MRFRLVDRLVRDPGAERSALIAGLRARPAVIPPKYFYDELGSALYGAICELPEYYPTRTERAIFTANRVEIANAIGTGGQFVDLGAGDGAKAEGWLSFLAPKRYVAVDIAAHALKSTLERLAPRFADVQMTGVVSDFTTGLDLESELRAEPVAFFYPGSSIGNFTPAEAHRFLAMAAALLQGGGLLVGVDLVKDPAVLHRAYNDAEGVTAAFNKNLLARANRELGSDFDVAAFDHYAFYSPAERRIEMHLLSARRQAVHLAGERFDFEAGESLHTENSYKYSVQGFASLARAAGFVPDAVWCDEAGLFSVHWLAAPARPRPRGVMP